MPLQPKQGAQLRNPSPCDVTSIYICKAIDRYIGDSLDSCYSRANTVPSNFDARSCPTL